jgi:hypothetical protein
MNRERAFESCTVTWSLPTLFATLEGYGGSESPSQVNFPVGVEPIGAAQKIATPVESASTPLERDTVEAKEELTNS